MNTLKLGIVGAGRMAKWHLKAYSKMPNVEVVAIANPVSDRGRKLARKHKIRQHFTDASEMIRDIDINAVDICVPESLHKNIVLAALERGLHVYVEKPMCETARGADEIIEANKEAKRVVFNGFNYRYQPGFRRIRKVIESGRLGEIRYIRMMRTTKDSPDVAARNARKGDIFAGFHSHFIDLLFSFGFPAPKSVYASGTKVHDWPIDPDTATVALTYADGILAEITTSTASPGLAPEVLMIGTKGTLRMNFGRVSVVRKRDQWCLPHLVLMMFREAMVLPCRMLRNPFTGSTEHFVQCVLEGKENDSDERSAAAVLQVVDAAVESYKNGVPVSM